MKSPCYRVPGFGIVLLLLCPVSADEISLTVTDVLFEKDGHPYNEPVQFTVNCYGYPCKSWDCGRDADDLLARGGNYSPEPVFSYHATCPQYGCRIYEPYSHAGRSYCDYCDLEGTTRGKEFRILSFSQSPEPENCTELQPCLIGGGRSGGNYYGTPEYDACLDEVRRSRDRCDRYLATCDPADDTECREWSVDGRHVKETPSYRACRDTADREKADCDRFLKEVDPPTMVMGKDTSSRSEYPARMACELRFTIPSDNAALAASLPVSGPPGTTIDPGQQMAGSTYGTRAVATARYAGPPESLSCSLRALAGARC